MATISVGLVDAIYADDSGSREKSQTMGMGGQFEETEEAGGYCK
jgi:hypothetical protein